MKSTLRNLLVTLVLGLMANPARSAVYNYDLLVGFTVGSGNDLIYDLGSPAAINHGQTWNLSALLSGYNLTNVQWGVIGNSTNRVVTGTGIASVPSNSVFSTYFLNPISGRSAYNKYNTAAGAIYSQFASAGAGQYVSVPVAGGGPGVGGDNSWYSETTSAATLATQYYNIIVGTPDVIGLTNVALTELTNYNVPATVVGYFILDHTGTLTYQTNNPAGGSNPALVANFYGIPISGFVPLQVVFTNTSTGSYTNAVWSLGNGLSVTNAGGNVTNTYVAIGKYSVSLIVNGAGGASTNTLANYISVYPTPSVQIPLLQGGGLVLSGTNCPAGVQYRILSTTNVSLALTNWTPVWTNTFNGNGQFAYTNAGMTNKAAFFKLVSP